MKRFPCGQLTDRALRMLAEPDVERIHRLAIGCLHAAAGGQCDPVPEPDDRQGSIAYRALLLILGNAHTVLTLVGHGASRADRTQALHSIVYLRARAAARIAERRMTRPSCGKLHADSAMVSQAIAFAWMTLHGRSPSEGEVAQCIAQVRSGASFQAAVLDAKTGVAEGACLPFLGDGRFVQFMHEALVGRGATAEEVQTALLDLEAGASTREELIERLADNGRRVRASLEAAAEDVGRSCWIMGTDRHITAQTWEARADELARDENPTAATAPPYRHRFDVSSAARPLVAVVTSLYRGAPFIEAFMRNITSLQGFEEYCELIIVDACSPDRESEIIAPYLHRHHNIKYRRLDQRVGIYEAWNIGIGMSEAPYITNANVDDLRRHDSLMLQAGVLEHLPFVDVAYQDLLYTFDPTLSYEAIAAFGYRSALPLVTPLNIFHCNSPHNAPMWRRRLHQELGGFDETYQSAGDYEFWLRCIAAGKVFYKLNDPHLVYYQNPDGMSTRPGTAGLGEAMRATKAYARRLLPPEISMATSEFATALGQRLDALPGGIRGRYAWARQALHDLATGRKFSASPPVLS